MTADVFISYSREDKDRVTALANELRAAGISLWIDQGGIDAAAMWSEEIVNALEGSKVLLLMVTEKAVNSHNVVKEVTIASERKGHILPVHLEPTRIPQGLKYPLAGIQHVEYFQGDPKENLKLILRALERLGIEAKAETREVPTAASAPAATTHSMHSDVDFAKFGNSIAVLPFENMSNDKDSDYFSDGLTDELITNLSKIAELHVISRILSQPYKGTKKDPRTIGRELEARYFVAGGVRKAGENLRISAQLIDIASGRELWAETYKGTMADVFDIQERVAKEIAEALKLKLSPVEKAVLTKRPTIVPEAYDCNLRARYFLYIATKSNLQFAIELFARAIELDTRYADAYAGLALSYTRLYQVFERDDKLLEKAMDTCLKALMYDKESGEAYAALALVQFARGQQEEGTLSLQRASELESTNYLSYWMLGRAMMNLDRVPEACALFRRSIELNPDDYVSLEILRMAYDRLGEHDLAKETYLTILSRLPGYIAKHPEDARARMLYAASLASQGNVEAARVATVKALQISPNDALMLYYAACLYSEQGDLDLALNALVDSVQAGWKDFEWIKRDPDLNSIRNHPGYIELMKDK